MAGDLVGDLSTTLREPDVPEMPAASKPLAIPDWKEPVLEYFMCNIPSTLKFFLELHHRNACQQQQCIGICNNKTEVGQADLMGTGKAEPEPEWKKHQRGKTPLRQQDMDIRNFFSKKGSKASGEAEPESQEEAVSTDQISECDDSILLAEELEGTSSTTTDTEVGDGSIAMTAVCDVTDLGDVDSGSMQPKLKQYPYEMFGSQKRSFQFHWFEKYNWLEYSCSKNTAFCFACRNFAPKGKRHNLDALLTTQGFKNWKRALDSFKEHERSALHKSSMLAWAACKDAKLRGNVVEQIEKATELQIRERRQYLERIVATTVLLAKQGISFRGHLEGEGSLNRGNFKECLNYLRKFDPFLQKYKPPGNATYTSPSSQNDLIQCCSEEITSTIVRQLKKSGMYAIMADEARDKRKEQLAICVRFVEPDTSAVKEHFLGFCELKDLSANSITESLEDCLTVNGLANVLCVAQTYDGAAVMSGLIGGVQAKFQKKHPEAIYVHCYAHELNLVLCYTCKAIPEASDFFQTLENLYTFFSVSFTQHQKFIDVQAQLGLKETELVQLSETRWSSQIRSITALIRNFTAVVQCLKEEKSAIATGLLIKLRRLSMRYCLFAFELLLGTTEGFHKLLQKENLDLSTALEYKKDVCTSLRSLRTNAKSRDILQKAVSLFDTDTENPQTSRQIKKPRMMEDFVHEARPTPRDHLSSEDDLRTKIFYPCLDRMLSELDHRFSSIKETLVKGIEACNPLSGACLYVRRHKGTCTTLQN
ncbi:zinc finger MYM-type protein 1-like [Aquarana catesbeiana]|uniref:zinc finger MYM-type protein 1-like n=1 Tax=Aquarana catesbeiana TaxID=8400 RepID=UPI003CCA1DFF